MSQAMKRNPLVLGNKTLKDVTDDMSEWKTQGTKLYQQLPADCKATLKPCEPLREIEADRPQQQDIYKTWKETKSK